MLVKKYSEYDRFIGKWVLKIYNETINIEFLKDGGFKCFSKNYLDQNMFLYSEGLEKKHYLYDIPKGGHTWELKNEILKILLSNKEQNFKYDFSNSDKTLTLTNIETKESLTFQKSSDSKVGSIIPWYLKLIFFLVLYYSIFAVIINLFLILGLEMYNLIIISWGLVFLIVIIIYYLWKKEIRQEYE